MDDESRDEKIVKKMKKTQVRKGTVARMTTTKTASQEKKEKATKINYRLFKQLIVIK